MNDKVRERTLTTADLAAAADADTARAADRAQPMTAEEPQAAARVDVKAGEGDAAARADAELAPLFLPDVAKEFRARWEAVQVGFVDDPRAAVRHGDELVAQVMRSLAETFSSERAKLESQFEQTDKASTENLRLAFRRYRSFFERLLSL